jgi:hypothetical protein
MSDRPCTECIWRGPDGCWKWDCEPVTREEAKKLLNIVKCRDCKNWQTPITYTPTGKCKLDGKITNRNFFCADGREKDG